MRADALDYIGEAPRDYFDLVVLDPPKVHPPAIAPAIARPPLHFELRCLNFEFRHAARLCVGPLSWVHLGSFAVPARKLFKLGVLLLPWAGTLQLLPAGPPNSSRIAVCITGVMQLT